jgi:uncharacterized membrane protein
MTRSQKGLAGFFAFMGTMHFIIPRSFGLLLAVFPANIHMALSPEQVRGLDLNRVPR